MVDVRCKACNKILLKANIFVGAIRCHRCKMVIEYRVYSNMELVDNSIKKPTIKIESIETSN